MAVPRTWRIITGGPVVTYVGTVDEVVAYVEKMAPLSRGWSGTWAVRGDGKALRYVRVNSKGRPQYTTSVVLVSGGRRPAGITAYAGRKYNGGEASK